MRNLPSQPRSLRLVVPLVVLLAIAVPAQQNGKRPLIHKDYDAWRAIASQALSPDGRYIAYSVFPQEGDGEVIVRELATQKDRHESAGAAPPPPDPSPDAPPPETVPVRGVNLTFTSDSRFLIFNTFPPKAATDQAKKDKKKPEEMPKGGLVIMDLKSETSSRLADVKSYQAPSKNPTWLAYLKEAKPGDRAASSPEAQDQDADQEDQRRGGAAAGRGPPSGRKELGTDLVLRNLSKGDHGERTFEEVTEYSFEKDGRSLVFAVSSKKPETNGAFAIAPGSDAAPVALLSGKGTYTKFAWDRQQAKLAFLSDRDDSAARQPKFKLYVWNNSGAATEIVSTSTQGFRSEFVISERANLSFSRDGSRLFFGAAPPQAPQRDAEAAAPDDERVSVDLWHWKDDHVQPMQKVRAAQDRNRTYRAVYNLGSSKLVQLADPSVQTVSFTEEGRYVVGADDRAYRPMVEFDSTYSDYYLLDTATGDRKPLLKKARGTFTLGGGGGAGGGGGFGGGGAAASAASPDGQYLLFYQDKNWHTIHIPDGKMTNLTLNRGVNFYNEENDVPADPPSYGSAGWTKDGKFALIYDKYDVWRFSPEGQSARNVTDGYGRKEKVQFRVVRLDPVEDDEVRGIDPSKPLLLRAESQVTRESGFWRAGIEGAAAPRKLLMAAKSFRTLGKAKDADVVMLTASTFNEFPDLQVTNSNFTDLRRVSDANPQKSGLLWGTSELVTFKNADGVSLQAALYKPENFDPKKKYPMIVYIYERLSQGVHTFVPPRPMHSINLSYYVSNGYLILTPDIIYTEGHPGQSALKCVLPAIQTVVDKGFVNESAIGIQGHSWGGYQIAYMVTQTNRFRAAEAGAPVGNMTSAYNGIRWATGLPRQFQYEKTQSRIGTTLWKSPQLFIENSAIFQANKIETPLLILHNDADDAVPWYQGIELYLSLRRLGKETYFFSYNGEPHGIRRRPNQKDYTVRMQQFFDHFLKGAASPEWMEKGIPFLERDQEKERLKRLTDQ